MFDSCSPMNHSPPGSSVHGISKARILEWVAVFLLRVGGGWCLPNPEDWTHISCVSCIGRQGLDYWATREVKSLTIGDFLFHLLKKLRYSCWQICGSFCCITEWICYMFTYISSLLGLPLTPSLVPPLWVITEHWAEPLVQNSSFLLSSVQFNRLVVSDSLRPHGPQHPRPPCPSPTPGVYSNSCPLSQWCHPTISSSVVPFSSCPQSFPASGSFLMSQLFTSGGQRIGVSASTSVFPMNIQD